MTDRDVSWVAVDWGTTHLRAWAMDGNHQVVADVASDKGMNVLDPDQFEPVLVELIGDCLTDGRVLPVIACGMVGARQGWVEADYAETPCPPLNRDRFKRAAVDDPRIEVLIIPGLKQARPADVMRGEETQIAGLLGERPDFQGTICMPGTHCKWARVQGGTVVEFKTSMTGELFALLEGQSILRHSLGDDGFDMVAFQSTIAGALDEPSTALLNLFSIRADDLLGHTQPAASRARLSGYLIASEVHAARSLWEGRDVVLLGADRLVALYGYALRAAAARVETVDGGHLTVAGLIAAKKLVEEPDRELCINPLGVIPSIDNGR